MRTFHHLGLVTKTAVAGEAWYDSLKVWGTNPDNDPNRIEWVRFAPIARWPTRRWRRCPTYPGRSMTWTGNCRASNRSWARCRLPLAFASLISFWTAPWWNTWKPNRQRARHDKEPGCRAEAAARVEELEAGDGLHCLVVPV